MSTKLLTKPSFEQGRPEASPAAAGTTGEAAAVGASPLNLLTGVYMKAGLDHDLARRAADADLVALSGEADAGDDPEQMPRRGPPLGGVVAAFAAVYLIWGSTYLGIRFAVESIPPFLMAGSRFLAAGLILYVLALWRGASPRVSAREWGDAAVIGALMLLIGNGAVTWAELTVASSVAALVIAITPMWMVILDWLRPGGARPGPGVWGGLVLGVAGVGLLVRGEGGGGGSRGEWLPMLALLAASVGWAIGALYNRQARKPKSQWMAVAVQMIAGGGWMLMVAWVRGEPAEFEWAAVTWSSLLAWGYLCLVGSVIAFTAYVWLLNVSTPSRVSTTAFVNPLVAVILGCTLGHEPFTTGLVLSAGLIIAAVALIVCVRTGAARLGKAKFSSSRSR